MTKENSQVSGRVRGRGKNVADVARTAFSAGRPNDDGNLTEFSEAKKDGARKG